jgi:hypothetical protein
MALIDEVFSILANSKNILDLPTATNIQLTDWAVVWNVNTERAEKVRISQIPGVSAWIWIEDSFVEKGSGNLDKALLEANDIVYFKKITNAGDPITLIGHTYDGGDKQLQTSYTQNQALTT